MVEALPKFLDPTAVKKNSNQNSVRVSVKCTDYGVRKLANFDRRLSRNRYETGLYLLWICNRKLRVADRSVSVPMTLSRLEKRDAMAKFHFFPADLVSK